ncbi:hypothetical protein G6F37_012915 [Rhizopus arrhizus]|nr:hypothetical protein G6F38_012559 [Rhizopus arrhizus]KAG1140831.1 hypothetical protein G6F37_012915 [Rhizopus arrhizus]
MLGISSSLICHRMKSEQEMSGALRNLWRHVKYNGQFLYWWILLQTRFALLVPDDICPTSLDEMVTNIPPSCRLSEDDADMMTHPFELSEILDQVKCSPKVSSPGTDGLSVVSQHNLNMIHIQFIRNQSSECFTKIYYNLFSIIRS